MKWVDCFQQMPPKHEDVLVWVVYQDGVEDFTNSYIADDGWTMGSTKNFEVTHWMKIKKP